jgi:hypothetical protein
VPAITATPLPNLGQVLVTATDFDGTCIQIRRVIDSTGESAPLRPYVWVCETLGEFLHLSDGKAYYWDTEAPLDVPFHYEATSVDAFGTTIGASDPGVRGLSLPGFAGNATTPDNAALDITGDIDLRVDVTLANWATGSFQTFVAKYRPTGNQKSYGFGVNGSGVLDVFWSNNGSADLDIGAGVALTALPGQRLAVGVKLDVDNGAAGKTATFYTAPTMSGPWTPLGTPQTVATTTSIFASTAVLEVGSDTDGTNDRLTGTVHSVEVRNGIDGPLVADPLFYAQAPFTTSFTDGPGRVWTVNAPARIIGPTTALTTVSTSLTLASNGGFWLRDPVRPCNDVRMELCVDDPECGVNGGVFVAEMSTEGYAPNQVLQLPTNARRPIAITRQRRDADSQLTVVTATFPDRDAVLAINAPGSPLLFSAPPAYGVPDRYMSVANETVARGVQDHTYPARMIQMPFTTVDRPVGPTQGTCGHRIDDICATYPTWAAAQAASIDWGRILTGDPATLGLRTWLQVRSTWATWNDVKLNNVDWADVRSL